MSFFNELVNNRVLIITLVALLTAQILKIIFVLITCKKIDFARLFGTGGMPSSHSALVTSLSVAVGKELGFDSIFFAMSLVFALVVMYDAAGIRRAAGKQAEILNKMIDDLYFGDFKRERLKELLGHTPIEVFAGAFLGIFIGAIM